MNTIFSLDAWLWSRCDRPTSMDRYFLHSATKSRCEVRWLTGQLRASFLPFEKRLCKMYECGDGQLCTGLA